MAEVGGASAEADSAAAAEGPPRSRPNILITGTPGTGKSITSELLTELTNFRFTNVGEVIRTHEFHAGKDEAYDTFVLDEDSEDQLLDYMEEIMAPGGNIVEFHSCEFFPERWFDLVVVLTTDNTVLYDRLVRRGYSKHKVEENVQCEIMQVLVSSAHESYQKHVVKVLKSDTTDELEENVERIGAWAKAFIDARQS